MNTLNWCIAKLDKIINTPFSKASRGGLKEWLQNLENAFSKLEQIGIMTYASDTEKKRRLLLNYASPAQSMILEELCKDKTYAQTCNMLRKHALYVEDDESNSEENFLLQDSCSISDLQSSKGDTTSLSPSDLLMANLSRAELQDWDRMPKDIRESHN